MNRCTVMAVALAVAATGWTAALPAAAAGNPPRQKITWQACEGQNGTGPQIECGSVEVPVDYRHPGAARMQIKVARIRASQAAQRRVLMFNLGGPGKPGAGAKQMLDLYQTLSPEVRTNFDLVGLDTRGSDDPSNAVCDEARQRSPRHFSYSPVGPEEQFEALAETVAVGRWCKEAGAVSHNHESTAEQAKDLDSVRRALGVNKFTYFGLSYGSYLGFVYASMYPGRVERMVLDGALNPRHVLGRPGNDTTIWERTGTVAGADEALESAFAECDRVGTSLCASAGAIRRYWSEVYASLSITPLTPRTSFRRLFCPRCTPR